MHRRRLRRQSLCLAVGKPILLVDNRGLMAEQKAYLDKADVQDVYLIGGADVVSNKVGRELKAYDKDGKTERIAGDNRYKTSVEVAKAFFRRNVIRQCWHTA